MTDKPAMRLQNGDVIHEGGYGRSKFGAQVGPMLRNGAMWYHGESTGYYRCTGEPFNPVDETIIAAWSEPAALPEIGSVGTLAELRVKEGDTVECWNEAHSGTRFTIPEDWRKWVGASKEWWTLIARASQPAASPAFDPTTNERPFGLLSPAEQEAIKAWPHGWEIYTAMGFEEITSPVFSRAMVYRAKPAPVRETVAFNGYVYEGQWSRGASTNGTSHRITFDLIDGNIDCASVKMEEIRYDLANQDEPPLGQLDTI